MGTSRAARAPDSRRWRQVVSAMDAKDVQSIVDTTIRIALPRIPQGHIGSVASSALVEGLRFVVDVKEHGLESAAKTGSIRISKKYLAPVVSNRLWELAVAKVDPRAARSPFGRLAETAFKKTVSAIMRKGVKALEE